MLSGGKGAGLGMAPRTTDGFDISLALCVTTCGYDRSACLQARGDRGSR